MFNIQKGMAMVVQTQSASRLMELGEFSAHMPMLHVMHLGNHICIEPVLVQCFPSLQAEMGCTRCCDMVAASWVDAMLLLQAPCL